jgi:hypothetical protein
MTGNLKEVISFSETSTILNGQYVKFLIAKASCVYKYNFMYVYTYITCINVII